MSFGKAQGLPANVLGMFQSVGAVLGMAAAISYTVVERHVGVRRVGLLGLIVSQPSAIAVMRPLRLNFSA